MVKPRVFIDSSVFISALLSTRGGSFFILNTISEHCILQTNEYVFEEVQRIIREKLLDQGMRSLFFLTIGSRNIQILNNPSKRRCVSLTSYIEEGDTPILASALASSEYLVTLDNDFFAPTMQTILERESLSIVKPKGLIALFRNDWK